MTPLMLRDTSLSDSCTLDLCSFSCLVLLYCLYNIHAYIYIYIQVYINNAAGHRPWIFRSVCLPPAVPEFLKKKPNVWTCDCNRRAWNHLHWGIVGRVARYPFENMCNLTRVAMTSQNVSCKELFFHT